MMVSKMKEKVEQKYFVIVAVKVRRKRGDWVGVKFVTDEIVWRRLTKQQYKEWGVWAVWWSVCER